MGGGCCTVLGVQQPSATVEIEYMPYSALKRNPSLRPAFNKEIADFIERILRNNSPTAALCLLLYEYSTIENVCRQTPRFFVSCEYCNVRFCPTCFGHSEHAEHEISLKRNADGAECLCGLTCYSQAGLVCKKHCYLQDYFDNMDLQILAAAYQQAKLVVEYLAEYRDVDINAIATNEVALRVLAYAVCFGKTNFDAVSIGFEQPHLTATRISNPLDKMWVFELVNSSVLLRDTLFYALYCHGILAQQDLCLHFPHSNAITDAQVCISSGYLYRFLSDSANSIKAANYNDFSNYLIFFRMFGDRDVAEALLSKFPDLLMLVAYSVEELNSQFGSFFADLHYPTLYYEESVRPYVNSVTHLILPLLEFVRRYAINASDQQMHEIMKSMIINYNFQICILTNVVPQLALFWHSNSVITRRQLSEIAEALNYAESDMLYCLLKPVLKWIAHVETSFLENGNYNYQNTMCELLNDSAFFYAYVDACRFAGQLMDLQSQPMQELQKYVSMGDNALDNALQQILVLSQIYAAYIVQSMPLGACIAVRDYFLNNKAPHGLIQYSPLANATFRCVARRDAFLSARIEIKDPRFFFPHVFPYLPSYFYTNVTLCSSENELYSTLLSYCVGCARCLSPALLSAAEQLYVGRPLGVQVKLRLLICMLSGKHTAAVYLRYPEKRLHAFESAIFKISRTSDFSRQFSYLVSSRITADKLFYDEETVCSEVSTSESEQSDESKFCSLCGQLVLDPVQFACVRRTFNGRSLITACSHLAHYECYRRERPAKCPFCGLYISYLIAESRQMKAINKLFQMHESRMLGVVLDTIDYCTHVASLNDLDDEYKTRIIAPAKKCIEKLAAFMYIGENYEERIAGLQRYTRKTALFNPSAFPYNATRFLAAHPRVYCAGCGSYATAFQVCLHCAATLCCGCLCPCKGSLKWDVESNSVSSVNGVVSCKAPYRNALFYVPDLVFGCGELQLQTSMLSALFRRLLE